MSLLSFLQRNSDRQLLIEHNPYRVLAARFSRPPEGGALLDVTAEFEPQDHAGLRRWLEEHFAEQKPWLPAVASFVPPESLLARDTIQPRKLADPAYLPGLIRDTHRIARPDAWTLRLLHPLEGSPIGPDGGQRPALFCGVAHGDIHRHQQTLLDQRILPLRLDLGLLPLFASIIQQKARLGDKRAVVVAVIEREHTSAYILGREGIQTPAPVPHGFASIVRAAAREFALTSASAVRERLHHADEELLLRATKLVRAIGRDLKPLCDSYELTTGQPIGELYCAYLPPELAWINEPLNLLVGRLPFTLDFTAWLGGARLTCAPGARPPGAHWLGLLSLIAESDPAGADGQRTGPGPWRGDWRLTADLPSNDIVRRRFMANTVAAGLASAGVMATLWQGYAAYTLQGDSSYWAQQIRENQAAYDEVVRLDRDLAAQTARLNAAYTAMHPPYPVTNLLLQLGRTRPEHVQLTSIASTDGGLVLQGSLRENSQQASRTLRAYVDTLRADPLLGPLFPAVTLTTLDRDSAGTAISFEITLRTKEPAR